MLPGLADYVNVIEFECRIAHHLPSRGDCRRGLCDDTSDRFYSAGRDAEPATHCIRFGCDPEGSRPYLGALLVAYYDPEGRLVYAGRAGTDIKQAELARLWRRLQPHSTSEMPLAVPPPRDSVEPRPLGPAGTRRRRQVSHLDR